MFFVCVFLPAVLFCTVRHYLSREENANEVQSILNVLVEYTIGVILINYLILLFRWVFLKKTDNIYVLLKEYSGFAAKYMTVSILLAVSLPYVEKFVRRKIKFDFTFSFKEFQLSDFWKRMVVIVIAIFFAIHNIIRMFDNSIWGDEGIVVVLARKAWNDMLTDVAVYGHTPFHYAFSWIFIKLFGESGFAFRLTASLPYFIILVISVTVIRRWLGNKSAVVLIVLSTLLDCAITYNMEIRMYAWCQLFVFLVYLVTYKIYTGKGTNGKYIFLALFSLGAVYSHYFALAAIGVLYLFLFIYNVHIRKDIRKVLVSGISVLALFFPWLVFAKKISGEVISNYNMELISWYDCVDFIFKSKYSMILLYAFFAMIVLWFIYDYKILRVEKDDQRVINVKVNLIPQINVKAKWVWIISGIVAVFGTICAAEAISNILYPIICLRYLYQSYIIIWLLFAIAISNMKLNRLWTALFVIIMFVSCYPNLLNVIKDEMLNNKRLKSTLEATQPEIDENDYIYTDIVHFAWTVKYAYYPETPGTLFGHPEWEWGIDEIPKLDSGIDYWLFLGESISEDIFNNLSSQSRTVIPVVEQGYIGTGDVWIYRIVDVE